MDVVSHASMGCLLGMCLASQTLPCAQADDPRSGELWRLVAQSHSIVVGIPRVPSESIRSALASRKPEYVMIPVACEQVLKGTAKQSVQLRFWTGVSDRGPNPERVVAMDRERAILFLVESNNAQHKGFFFAGDTPRALSEPDARLAAQIQGEVQHQRELLEHFQALFLPKDEPLYAEVKDLIDAVARKDTQAKAFADLEALGHKAVAAIIMLMDDRRELPKKAIALRNPEGHWEGMRHYGPETVTDAMATILNQITGECFGFIHNGGTEQERRQAVDGWRIYLCHLMKKTQINPAAGEP